MPRMASFGDLMMLDPWITEPHQVTWTDEETNLPCVILRHEMGFLCGYVGIPQDHPMFGLTLKECKNIFRIHGGITECRYLSNEEVLTTWENYHQSKHYLDAWFFSFDCGHYGDFIPGREDISFGIYRDIKFVKEQCKLLARQLSKRK